ncbi:MAG: branched-chain amino acid ABC transporter permease [Limnohabitans sp.]|nr:branched-chain amino acid ABC transporter permease [Limnohabitans sp.]
MNNIERQAFILGPASRVWGVYLLALLALLLPAVLLVDDANWINIIAFTYLMAAVASAWNIIGGFGGQFSLGHGVFFSIGAYLTAKLFMIYSLSPWLIFLPAALIAAFVAALISWPTFRLRGPFFAIATLAFNEVAFVLANHFDSFTGGPRGLMIPFRASAANLIYKERSIYTFVMFGFLALVLAVTLMVRRSRLGYYLLAIRENEDTARACGIDVLEVKLIGMALSAGLTSIGGGLFAMYLRYIDPTSLFTLPEVGVKFALLTLIGGIGTMSGPVLGAILVIPFENYLRTELANGLPGLNLVILGLLMVLAALFMKKGIVGVVFHMYRRYVVRQERS